MRSYAMIAALGLAAAAPLSAQSGTFRTDPVLRLPSPGGIQLPGQETRRDDAQRNQRSNEQRDRDHIPPGQLPPAGMCRIWIDGVPPGRQPAPTDCPTAVATKPANARVIWGDQTGFPGRANGKFDKQKGAKSKGGNEVPGARGSGKGGHRDGALNDDGRRKGHRDDRDGKDARARGKQVAKSLKRR